MVFLRSCLTLVYFSTCSSGVIPLTSFLHHCFTIPCHLSQSLCCDFHIPFQFMMVYALAFWSRRGECSENWRMILDVKIGKNIKWSPAEFHAWILVCNDLDIKFQMPQLWFGVCPKKHSGPIEMFAPEKFNKVLIIQLSKCEPLRLNITTASQLDVKLLTASKFVILECCVKWSCLLVKCCGCSGGSRI